jgi:hypothetical protein
MLELLTVSVQVRFRFVRVQRNSSWWCCTDGFVLMGQQLPKLARVIQLEALTVGLQ